MGDTIAIYKENTLMESTIIGKSCNHSPNEVFLTLKVDAKDYSKEETVKTTTIILPQIPHTYGMIVQKPLWSWGCETGMNEKGLAIGCETVVTKATSHVINEGGLIGNDVCRLVLERCESAKTGAEYIIELFEAYGHCQWVKGSLDRKKLYDYSYLIADNIDIYVIETAGKHWVRKRIPNEERIYAITNMLTINDDYDSCSESIKEKEKDGYKVHWKREYGRYLIASFRGAPVRRYGFIDDVTSDLDGRAMKISKHAVFGFKRIRHGDGNGVSIDTFKHALRRHMQQNVDRPSQPCMHFGDTPRSLCTVANIIYLPGQDMIASTMTSTPCRAIFIPMFLQGDCYIKKEGQEIEAEAEWIKREIVIRSSYTDRIDKVRYKGGIKEIEFAYDAKLQLMKDNTILTMTQINKEFWEYESKYFEQYLWKSGRTVKQLRPNIGTIFFKRLWVRVNIKMLERAKELGVI